MTISRKSLISNGLFTDNVILHGHSLGAHIVGAAGRALGGAAFTIVGEDPALPLFSLEDTDARLDTTDARYVQIIHTNGANLGFRSSIGHVDFHPNGGGIDQPGCGLDIIGGCAHGRAPAYHQESMTSNDFVSTLCSSYDEFKGGVCNGNPTTVLRTFTPDRT